MRSQCGDLRLDALGGRDGCGRYVGGSYAPFFVGLALGFGCSSDASFVSLFLSVGLGGGDASLFCLLLGLGFGSSDAGFVSFFLGFSLGGGDAGLVGLLLGGGFCGESLLLVGF